MQPHANCKQLLRHNRDNPQKINRKRRDTRNEPNCSLFLPTGPTKVKRVSSLIYNQCRRFQSTCKHCTDAFFFKKTLQRIIYDNKFCTLTILQFSIICSHLLFFNWRGGIPSKLSQKSVQIHKINRMLTLLFVIDDNFWRAEKIFDYSIHIVFNYL